MDYYSTVEQEMLTAREKLNRERTRTCRLRKKLLDCESILQELENHCLSTASLSDAIKENFRADQVDLLNNELVNSACPPEARRYSPSVKKFATTVFFHSPAAYRYLRQFLTLPNEVTLRKWLMKIDGSPGFTKTSLSIIQERIRSQDIEADCVLISDSMSIRKQLVYDEHDGRYVGYVDIGDGCEDTRVAGEALVILASGLKKKWRYPIGYFLVGKNVQVILIDICL